MLQTKRKLWSCLSFLSHSTLRLIHLDMPAHYTPGVQGFALRRRQDSAAGGDATTTGGDLAATTAADSTSAAADTTTDAAATTVAPTTAAQDTTSEAGELFSVRWRLFAGRISIGRGIGRVAEVWRGLRDYPATAEAASELARFSALSFSTDGPRGRYFRGRKQRGGCA